MHTKFETKKKNERKWKNISMKFDGCAFKNAVIDKVPYKSDDP